MVKDELLTLRTHFPNQTSPGFWTLVSATLKAPMHPLPDYPGVLLLLSDTLSRDTANCLASRLVEISSKVLARPGLIPPPAPSLVLPASSLPADPADSKQHLTDKLYAALGLGSAVALLDLEKIDPVAALTLHAFADNTNAPFKQANSHPVLRQMLTHTCRQCWCQLWRQNWAVTASWNSELNALLPGVTSHNLHWNRQTKETSPLQPE